MLTFDIKNGRAAGLNRSSNFIKIGFAVHCSLRVTKSALSPKISGKKALQPQHVKLYKAF